MTKTTTPERPYVLAPTTLDAVKPPAAAPTPATPKYTYVPPPKPDVSHLPLLDPNDCTSTLMRTLGRACTLKRDYGTQTEAKFVAWLANRLPVSLIDGAGNVHVDLRTTNAHRTMFTCHTDTVHNGGGANDVRIDGNFWRADGAALGADDGAGIALLCHMIEAGVPAYYVFFRGEERGGIGSKWLAEEMPALFASIDRAVAFDRADYYDVITHQSGGRCCSDEFAQALCDALGTGEDWFLPCDGGVYTDTAEFTDLVPECTNVSVGYKHQHGDREEQDIEFLQRLAALAVAVDWDALPTKRDPKVYERDDWRSAIGKYSGTQYSLASPSKYAKYDGKSAYKDWRDQRDAYEYEDDDSQWPNNGTTLDADDLDLNDELLNELECELSDALEAAIHDNNFSHLLDLVAKHAMPDDPDWMRHKLSKVRMSHMVARAYDDLFNGVAATDVLDDLMYGSEV